MHREGTKDRKQREKKMEKGKGRIIGFQESKRCVQWQSPFLSQCCYRLFPFHRFFIVHFQELSA